MDLKIPRMWWGEEGSGRFQHGAEGPVLKQCFGHGWRGPAGRAPLLPLCPGLGWGGVLQGGASVGMEPGPPGQQALPLCGVASLWLASGFRGSWRLMLLGFGLFHCFLGLPPVSVETESPRRALLTCTSSPPTFPTPLHADSEWFLTVK